MSPIRSAGVPWQFDPHNRSTPYNRGFVFAVSCRVRLGSFARFRRRRRVGPHNRLIPYNRGFVFAISIVGAGGFVARFRSWVQVGSFARFRSWVQVGSFAISIVGAGGFVRAISIVGAGGFVRAISIVGAGGFVRAVSIRIQEGRPTIPQGPRCVDAQTDSSTLSRASGLESHCADQDFPESELGDGSPTREDRRQGIELADRSDLLQRSGRLALAGRLDRPSRFRLHRTTRGSQPGARAGRRSLAVRGSQGIGQGDSESEGRRSGQTGVVRWDRPPVPDDSTQQSYSSGCHRSGNS